MEVNYGDAHFRRSDGGNTMWNPWIENNIMDEFAAKFETIMIQAALKATHGKRIEAAQRLGIGRNTITRKIQDLGIDVPD